MHLDLARSLAASLAIVAFGALAPATSSAVPDEEAAQAALRRLPVSIVPNVGQSGREVRYEVRGLGRGIAFTDDSAVLAGALRVRLLDVEPTCRLREGDPLPGHVNFQFGDDPSRWRMGVPTWESIVHDGAWRGIDVAWSGSEGQLKTEFHVAPGADPSRIRFAWEGSSATPRVAADGSLVVETAQGCVIDEPPIAWQEVGERREPVSARFVVHPDGTVGFAIDGWTRGRLVIDPVLDFSTWWGGSGADVISWIGGSGPTRIAGSTTSSDFPVLFAAQPANAGGVDLFITELFATGDAVRWSTYVGGSGDEGLSRHPGDLVGWTTSPDFPLGLRGRRFGAGGGRDALWIAELDDVGAVELANVVGGSGDDAFGGHVGFVQTQVLGGTTSSTGLAALGGAWVDATLDGPSDGLLVAFDCVGSSPCGVQGGSYLGGSGDESIAGLHVGPDHGGSRFYMVGQTSSATLPGSASGLDTTLGGASDGLIARVESRRLVSGEVLITVIASTYLGGSGADAARVASDSIAGADTAILVAGWTESADFPTSSAYQPGPAGGRDVTLSVLSGDLSHLVQSTYFGGSADEEPRVVLGASGQQWHLMGWTDSADLPTVDALQPSTGGGRDAFHAILRPDPRGIELLRSTYFGGSGDDQLEAAILVDCLYLAGSTTSSDLPALRNVQAGLNGASDGFLARICETRLPASGGDVTIGDVWTSIETLETDISALEAKLDALPDLSSVPGTVDRIETDVARVEAKLDALPDLREVPAQIEALEAKLDVLPDLREVPAQVEALEAKLDALPDLSEVPAQVAALEAKLDTDVIERDLSRLLLIEVMLHEMQCVPSLWLPRAEGGLLELATEHVTDLVVRAERDGEPHANVRLARQKLADAAASSSAGQHQRSCQDLSEALRAISPR